MTNSQFYYSIYRNDQAGKVSKNTYASRTSLLWHHLLEAYGSRSVQSMTGEDIDAIYDSLESRGFAHNTIYGVYAALSSFYQLAVEKGVIAQNPVRDARTIKPLLAKKEEAADETTTKKKVRAPKRTREAEMSHA